MVITFLGHRSVYNRDELSKKVKKAIMENIDRENNTVFFCGGYGDFDNLCACTCKAIKKERPNCEIVLITPYINKPQREGSGTKLYDFILYPPLESVPLKFAISKRNEWMVDQADLVIAYIDRAYGGAYKSFCYAKRKKKRIVNLADKEI